MQQAASQNFVDELLNRIFSELAVDEYIRIESEESDNVLIILNKSLESLSNLLQFWIFFFEVPSSAMQI
jgi:hypothetical protein